MEIEALACFRYTHWIGLDWISNWFISFYKCSTIQTIWVWLMMCLEGLPDSYYRREACRLLVDKYVEPMFPVLGNLLCEKENCRTDSPSFRSRYAVRYKHCQSLPFLALPHSRLSVWARGVANYCSGCSDCSGRLSSAAEGPNQPSALLWWTKQ